MFEGLNPWIWVAAAWLELVLGYLGYLVYLDRRARRIDEEER